MLLLHVSSGGCKFDSGHGFGLFLLVFIVLPHSLAKMAYQISINVSARSISNPSESEESPNQGNSVSGLSESDGHQIRQIPRISGIAV
jgi:hypothetical protein